MICLLVLSLLIAVAGGGMAQTPETADIYAPGRAIVRERARRPGTVNNSPDGKL